jgi:chromosome segregation ATPase
LLCAERASHDVEAEAAAETLRVFRGEVQSHLLELGRRVEQAEQTVSGVEKQWGASTTEGLRSLHVSVERLKSDSNARVGELKQVLSAEIQARQGGTRLLGAAVKELSEAEKADQHKLEKEVKQEVQKLQAQMDLLESRIKREEDTSAGLAARLHPIDESIKQTQEDITRVSE